MRKLSKVGKLPTNNVIKANMEAEDLNALSPTIHFFTQEAMEFRPIKIIFKKATGGWKKKRYLSEIERIQRGKHVREHNIPALMVFVPSYSCGQEV